MSEATKIHYEKVKLSQTTRFWRDGSVLQGTVAGGPVGIETTVHVESKEPPDKVAFLIKMAEQSCFTLQSLLTGVEVTAAATLNGAPLEVEHAGTIAAR